MLPLMLVVVFGCATVSAQDYCNSYDIDLTTRVVFGEARGESHTGQLAVAWVVVNRVNNRQFSYPNNVYDVVYQTYGSNYEFNTMGNAAHTTAYNTAKATNSNEYRNAFNAASAALCNREADPTSCALAFCAVDPCSATSDTLYATVYNKQKIGNHWFVCQRPK